MDVARLWATGILIAIISGIVGFVTLVVIGLAGLGLTLSPWLLLVVVAVVYVLVLPIVYGVIAKTIVEWLF